MIADTKLDTIFAFYLESRAGYQGIFGASASAPATSEAFYERLLALHKEYMSGECSFGYMAEQLGITYLALSHILNRMGLPATNT